MLENFVRLKIYSDTLSPIKITEFIGLQPDKYWSEGDFKPKTNIRYKNNGWILESSVDKHDNIDVHIQYILKRLLPFASKIKNISEKSEVIFSCVQYTKDSNPQFYFDLKILNQLSDLGANLELDLYSLPSPPEGV